MLSVGQKDLCVFHKTVRRLADCLVSELDSNEKMNNNNLQKPEVFKIWLNGLTNSGKWTISKQIIDSFSNDQWVPVFSLRWWNGRDGKWAPLFSETNIDPFSPYWQNTLRKLDDVDQSHVNWKNTYQSKYERLIQENWLIINWDFPAYLEQHNKGLWIIILDRTFLSQGAWYKSEWLDYDWRDTLHPYQKANIVPNIDFVLKPTKDELIRRINSSERNRTSDLNRIKYKQDLIEQQYDIFYDEIESHKHRTWLESYPIYRLEWNLAPDEIWKEAQIKIRNHIPDSEKYLSQNS
jgi:hypothetical protein